LKEKIMLSPRQGEMRMFSDGSANPEQLDILATAFQDYCREHRIEPYSHDAEDAGRLVMQAFTGGARTPEQLKMALAVTRKGERLQA
jgi:hypothetical protein